MTHLRKLPYVQMIRLLDWIKKRLYTVEWPYEKDGVVFIPPEGEDMDTLLREKAGFEGSHLSYDYEGQEFDLRKPYGLSPDGMQMELHVRGKHISEDEIHAVPHLEPSRYEHHEAHISGNHVDWEGAVPAFKKELDKVSHELVG